MRKKVFVDGQEGTTGLGIHERISGRHDIELLAIPADRKKDRQAKRDVMAAADIAILCLPDAAAVESVAIARDLKVKVIDASTAHRTARGWVYGMPELSSETRRAIADARFVANPGCYPTGFLLAVRPLVDAEVLPRDYPVNTHAISGFSGGGKKLIAAFEEHAKTDSAEDWRARPYGLDLKHKHIPEMHVFSGLAEAPIFTPVLGDYYKGMLVMVPLFGSRLKKRATASDVHAILSERYASERFVRVMPFGGQEFLEGGCLSPTGCNDSNDVELFVFGQEDRILLIARLDNLGKGASGAAVQNLNLMLGFDETSGLV